MFYIRSDMLTIKGTCIVCTNYMDTTFCDAQMVSILNSHYILFLLLRRRRQPLGVAEGAKHPVPYPQRLAVVLGVLGVVGKLVVGVVVSDSRPERQRFEGKEVDDGGVKARVVEHVLAYP